MGSPVRTSFGPIIRAMRDELVLRLAVPPEMVKIIARRDLNPTLGGQMVYLRPSRFMSQDNQAESTGRIDTRLSRQVAILLKARNVQDDVAQDEDWLCNGDLGLFALEDRVLDALQIFFPLDATGKPLTCYPIRLLTGDEAAKSREKQGWGDESFIFEAVYQPLLDQSRQ